MPHNASSLANGRENWTAKMMLTPCLGNNSAFFCVPLFGERIMNFGGGFNLKVYRIVDGELTIAKKQLHIIQ